MAAEGQELVAYKQQYELMDDSALIQEYKYLKVNKRDTESRIRFAAVVNVLEDRGYHRENN
jgi:hypothetical protein